MYGTYEYADYDKLWKSTASAAGSDDEYNEYNSDDRTSILVILHTSFRETMLPAATWHMQPDDDTTGDDLKKWVQWKIWETHWVWIELNHMWLELVTFDSPADYPHGYKWIRKIDFKEQVREVLHQCCDMPVVQVRRSIASGSSSRSEAAKRQRV